MAKLALASISLIALSACGAQPEPSDVGEALPGQVALSLGVGPEIALDQASYAIVGPRAFSRTGALDVSDAGKLTAIIGGLPAGNDFSLTLSARGNAGKVSCSGSAPFDVSAGSTTLVELRAQCREQSDRGAIDVGGTINVCPVLDELSASPGEVTVGAAIDLVADAHDSDSGPAALTFQWSASAGSLVAQGGAARLTCLVPGKVVVTVAVSDGAADCSDSQQVELSCAGGGAPPAQPAPMPPVLSALLAAGLLLLGLRRFRATQSS